MNRGDFGTKTYGATTAIYGRPQSSRENDNFVSLCDDVSGKIFLINKNVIKLESLSKTIDSPSYGKDTESKIHTLSQETNKLATEAKNVFKQILEFTRSGRYASGQGPYNLQQSKLHREFENSLSRYHAIQNVLSLRMKANIQQEVRFTRERSISEDAQLLQKQQLIQEDRLNQQIQLEAEVAEAKEREARLRQIEEDVLNVNDIFRDLALLVHEQGQTIDSIEGNMVTAADHVGAGNRQLLRATNYQKSARKRMCIIAVIVIVVAIVLGLIIYYTVK